MHSRSTHVAYIHTNSWHGPSCQIYSPNEGVWTYNELLKRFMDINTPSIPKNKVVLNKV